MQKFQNTNTTKYKLPKYKFNKIQMEQNTNATKYKWNKIQIKQNAKIPKYKHSKIQEEPYTWCSIRKSMC